MQPTATTQVIPSHVSPTALQGVGEGVSAPPMPSCDGLNGDAAAGRNPLRVSYVATQGSGSSDEARVAALLAPFGPRRVPFDRQSRVRSCAVLLWRLLRERPDMVVMEGTGWGGGVAVMTARLLRRVPYIVSSGDAVGPYLGLISRWLRFPGRVYERLLCGLSAGYIGWSPYLVGRAVAMGAPRAMTAANWSRSIPTDDERRRHRATVRRELGIPEGALVVGLVGSLSWSRRRSYCYGLELVRAARQTSREDLRIVILGDGEGRRRLEKLAGDQLGRRILLPGEVPPERVVEMLCAMDVASLPQSVDQVGSVRYTTKLSEYLAAGVPVVTGQLPLAYDLDDGWLWRLPGAAPWDDRYVASMSSFLATVDRAAVQARVARVPRLLPIFDFERQHRAVYAFVTDAAEGTRAGSARDEFDARY
jgi:glycosyltransferase involved in cell wall biosynthesis